MEMDTSTGSGHAGAGAVALTSQEVTAADRSQQSFGGLMVSLNTFLQNKLVREIDPTYHIT